MQSDLFGHAKSNASFGRLRAQMHEVLIEQNAATVDNRRGRKCHAVDDEGVANNNPHASVDPSTLPPLPFDSTIILAKTLMYLNANSLEKERQRNAQLMIRNTCDKLTSQRWNEDALFQALDHSYRNKRKPEQALFDKQNAIENEIASLEQRLDKLQSDKYCRHYNMINRQQGTSLFLDPKSCRHRLTL